MSYPIVDSLGRKQEATFVTEAGLYDVIIRSDSPLAKPYGKRPNDYLSQPSTNRLIKAITRKYGSDENQLVRTRAGSPENGGGTWMNKILALRSFI